MGKTETNINEKINLRAEWLGVLESLGINPNGGLFRMVSKGEVSNSIIISAGCVIARGIISTIGRGKTYIHSSKSNRTLNEGERL